MSFKLKVVVIYLRCFGGLLQAKHGVILVKTI